ncbi:MAG: fused response regulator/phosphatase [Thermodesulfobacteriota bacterium]|nr:fused response regulator/phosphatase [Thermodesulfobacteriota bacterium]
MADPMVMGKGKQVFKVLVVDDEQGNLDLLGLVLGKEGYKVLGAVNGEDARRIAKGQRPDLILLDIMMPEENGFEVMGRLKQDPSTSSIPVILLSGISDVNSKIKGFDLGAVDYITKPFNLREVLARVRLHLKMSLATRYLLDAQAGRIKELQAVQSSILVAPDDLPLALFDVYYKSLFEAGGDLYDVLEVSKDIFGYFVGDISGHDPATGYLVSAVKALLKQNCTLVYDPLESMEMINHVLCRIFPAQRYMTACYARLNRRKGLLSVVSSAHPPLLYLPVHADPEFIEAGGDILGMFDSAVFGYQEIEVNRGDRFIMYTDGLIERPDDNRVWTAQLDHFLDICRQLKGMSLEETVGQIRDRMWKKGNEQQDDVVILGIEV